jgi:preprotein translocase subunit SecG
MALSLALSFVGNLVVALFVLVCLALVLIILLQKGRGGGIGAAFGGAGAGSLLGTKTGDFLTWVTICLVAGFLVLAVLMGKFMRPQAVLSDLSAPVETQTTTTVDENAAATTEAAEAPADTAAAEAAEETTPASDAAADDVASQPAGDTTPKPEASNTNQ